MNLTPVILAGVFLVPYGLEPYVELFDNETVVSFNLGLVADK